MVDYHIILVLLFLICGEAWIPPTTHLKGLSRLSNVAQKKSLAILKVTQPTESSEDRSSSMMTSFLDSQTIMASLIGQAALVGITLVITLFTKQLQLSTLLFDFESIRTAVFVVAPLIIGRLVFVNLPLDISKDIKKETRKFVINMFGSDAAAVNVIFLTLLLSFTSGFSSELFFRGLVFNSIESSTNAIVALFLSSGIFGFVRSAFRGTNIVAEAFIGGILGYAYWYSDYNLAVPIAIHTMYDFVTLFLTWYFSKNERYSSD